jgi:hypothetical protein
MNKYKMLGLAGIPLALMGIVTSAAFAASKPPVVPVAPAPQQVAAAPTISADTDVETNDDVSGPQEATGVEQAD